MTTAHHIVLRDKNTSGESFVIRYPTAEDAQRMCDYINVLSKEQTFIRFQGEYVALEAEKSFLDNILTKIANKQAVMLLTFLDDELIGISQIEMKDRTEAHEGEFGISLAKTARGKGIGKKLMQAVMAETQKNIPQLKVMTLSVFANNPIAKKLYEQMGFREFGRLPRGIAYKSGYVDRINMFKLV